MRRSKITTAQIIEDFKRVHGNKYGYLSVDYKTMHTKVDIYCNKHGVFKQTPNAHIRLEQGCPKCKFEENSLKQKDNTESFIIKAKEIHRNRYDYSLVEYEENAHTKVRIICKEHGEFLMTPNSHLSKRSNCPKCSKSIGWSKTQWIEQCKDKVAKLYIIRCYNEEESFYKIGITSRETLRDRFNCIRLMPYEYEVIKVVEDDAEYIFNLEKLLHKLHKKDKYTPILVFDGWTECFSKLLVNAEIH